MAKPRGTTCPEDQYNFTAAPIKYFDNPMTGFVNRIDTANQKLCETIIKIKLSDVVFARYMVAKEEWKSKH